MSSQHTNADSSVQTSWVESETGTVFSVRSETGGPGWDGAHYNLSFRKNRIEISASWPHAFGEYFVKVSTISMPRELLEYRAIIEKFIVEAISVYCASAHAEDFSPKAFACTVDMSRVTYIHGQI